LLWFEAEYSSEAKQQAVNYADHTRRKRKNANIGSDGKVAVGGYAPPPVVESRIGVQCRVARQENPNVHHLDLFDNFRSSLKDQRPI